MSRRKSDSFENLINIAARLRWWVGVLLALVTYIVLHAVAGMEAQAPKDLQGLGAFTAKQIIKAIAMFAQYLLPIALLIGAGMSAYGRWKRNGLHARAVSAGGLDVMQDMSWQEFELLVGEAFRRRGFSVKEVGGGGADGGVDLVLSSGTETYLVQCKKWRAMKVPVQTVRELYGVMAAKGASGGFVVSSGEFTADAAEFATGRNIELISHTALQALLEAETSLSQALVESAPHSNLAGKLEIPTSDVRPDCPVCGRNMVRRVARQGAYAGKPFWGCQAFPKCRGKLAI